MKPEEKSRAYAQAMRNINSLTEGERDEIAVMATIAAELRHAMSYFDWVGFYRVVRPGVLKVGPYQGSHGCLTIAFDKGVCGKCAREKATQVVGDVAQVPYHIACSSSTRSEIVVPIVDIGGNLHAVLDVDSNLPEAFDEVDREALEILAAKVASVY